MKNKRNRDQKSYNEVEFSSELADSNDMEAMKRMEAANSRAKKRTKNKR